MLTGQPSEERLGHRSSAKVIEEAEIRIVTEHDELRAPLGLCRPDAAASASPSASVGM